jgi:hypothetical protein
MKKRSSLNDILAKQYGLRKIEYTEYLEIECLEWIENVPENIKQKNVFIITKDGQKNQTVNAKNYDYNPMKIINKYSKEGWKVVSFTDTFVYRNRGNPSVPKIDILQRRKCYLLNRTTEEYINE